jgi:hypothetical protein
MIRGGRVLVVLAVVVTAVLAGCTDSRGGPRAPGPTAAAPSGAESPAAGSPSPGPEPGNERPGTTAELAEVFGENVTPRTDGAFGLDRWSLVDTGVSAPSGTALRVWYPKGSSSPASSEKYGSPEGGMQTYLTVDGQGQDEAYLRYWVRFPADFEFVRGGKLPGLFGGTKVSGGEHPDGTNGFSTRLMWRSGGAGEVYLYAPHESGTSLGRGNWTWPRGAWTCVEEQVVLNRPGEGDGAVTVWLDGTEVLTQRDILYRTVDQLRIEGIFFSTFFGGADPGWAPDRDQHVDFAGFAFSDQRVGCPTG